MIACSRQARTASETRYCWRRESKYRKPALAGVGFMQSDEIAPQPIGGCSLMMQHKITQEIAVDFRILWQSEGNHPIDIMGRLPAQCYRCAIDTPTMNQRQFGTREERGLHRLQQGTSWRPPNLPKVWSGQPAEHFLLRSSTAYDHLQTGQGEQFRGSSQRRGNSDAPPCCPHSAKQRRPDQQVGANGPIYTNNRHCGVPEPQHARSAIAARPRHQAWARAARELRYTNSVIARITQQPKSSIRAVDLNEIRIATPALQVVGTRTVLACAYMRFFAVVTAPVSVSIIITVVSVSLAVHVEIVKYDAHHAYVCVL